MTMRAGRKKSKKGKYYNKKHRVYCTTIFRNGRFYNDEIMNTGDL